MRVTVLNQLERKNRINKLTAIIREIYNEEKVLDIKELKIWCCLEFGCSMRTASEYIIMAQRKALKERIDKVKDEVE